MRIRIREAFIYAVPCGSGSVTLVVSGYNLLYPFSLSDCRAKSSTFTREQKAEIIREVLEQFISPRDVARKYNISPHSIRDWIKKTGAQLPKTYKRMPQEYTNTSSGTGTGTMATQLPENYERIPSDLIKVEKESEGEESTMGTELPENYERVPSDLIKTGVQLPKNYKMPYPIKIKKEREGEGEESTGTAVTPLFENSEKMSSDYNIIVANGKQVRTVPVVMNGYTVWVNAETLREEN